MYFSTTVLVAVLAAVAQAVRIDFPPGVFAPTEGVPITLHYSEAVGPVTITVTRGVTVNLQPVQVIFTDLPAGSGSFTWTPSGLPSDTYALEIDDGSGKPNYSPQFPYVGTATASQSSTPSATPTSASSSVSSSASNNTTTTSSSSSSGTTMTTSSHTTTRTTATTSTPAATTTAASLNGGSSVGSSMALLLGAAAIFAFFN